MILNKDIANNGQTLYSANSSKQNINNNLIFYRAPYDKKKLKNNGVKCLLFSLAFLAVVILGGFVNPDSSHTFWIVFPYLFLFLPVGFHFYGAFTIIGYDELITKRGYDKGIERVKHSAQAELILGIINIILDIVYIIIHLDGITLVTELIYLGSLITLVILAIIFGLSFDKMFYGFKIETVNNN